MEQKNWVHFERAAMMMIASGCQDEEEWVAAQFIGASITNYPYPNNLGTEAAAQKYIEFVDMANFDDSIKTQEGWVEYLRYTFPERSISEIVMDPYWSFHSWFRIYHTDKEYPRELALEAQRELHRSTALRRSIEEAGYDLEALERKIGESLS